MAQQPPKQPVGEVVLDENAAPVVDQLEDTSKSVVSTIAAQQ